MYGLPRSRWRLSRQPVRLPFSLTGKLQVEARQTRKHVWHVRVPLDDTQGALKGPAVVLVLSLIREAVVATAKVAVPHDDDALSSTRPDRKRSLVDTVRQCNLLFRARAKYGWGIIAPQAPGRGLTSAL